MSMQELMSAARASKAWPFQEAQRLLKRYPDGVKPDGSPVLFETGYGPSGLPHIGTFQEVLRTTLVRRVGRHVHPTEAGGSLPRKCTPSAIMSWVRTRSPITATSSSSPRAAGSVAIRRSCSINASSPLLIDFRNRGC